MDYTFVAENVSKSYTGHQALKNVSISVPTGTIFGLLGPNGAGKTTLIRIINQIIYPDMGRLFFNGERLNPSQVSLIGYLPEERGLYKKMKVGEQAIYLSQLKGVPERESKKKLKQWFEKFDLMPWWNKKVEELSKGMAQKVQFIITVLHEPKLLVFDEPFSGFDPINVNLIKEEILKLKENGVTIIFSTHNMGSVEELCDHIALINKSEKILDGSVKKIKSEYSTNIFQLEIGNLCTNVESLFDNRFSLVRHSNQEGVHSLRVRVNKGVESNELVRLVLNNGHLVSFAELTPSMNDIFIKNVTGLFPQETDSETFRKKAADYATE